MDYPNILLVDCFIRHRNQLLMVRRKASEIWFPTWLGSLWREVRLNHNPYQELQSLLDKHNIKPRKICLKAIANNVFHDLKETFNVFLFIVDVDEKPGINEVPEGDEIVWIDQDKMLDTDKVLIEYKKVFPKFKENTPIFYHTEYDADKMLDFQIFS